MIKGLWDTDPPQNQRGKPLLGTPATRKGKPRPPPNIQKWKTLDIEDQNAKGNKKHRNFPKYGKETLEDIYGGQRGTFGRPPTPISPISDEERETLHHG